MVLIPILPFGVKPTESYIRTLRTAIRSDACSKSPDIYGCCCVLHDLAYRYGIDCFGRPTRKDEADRMLKRCMQEQSKLKKFSFISRIYYWGVRLFGANAYVDGVDNRQAFETYPYKGSGA